MVTNIKASTDFKQVPLKNLFKINTKSINPKKLIGNVTHYSLPAYDKFKAPIIEDVTSIKSNKTLIEENTILVSKLNPRINRTWLVRASEKDDIKVSSTEFINYVAITNLNLDFYYYFFSSEIYQEELLVRESGTTGSRKRVIPSDTLAIKLPFPTLEEQQKIAEILKAIDEQIEKTKQLMEKSKELKKGLMQQLLTKGIGNNEFKQTELGEVPITWEIIKQGKIATFLNGRAYKQTEFTESGTQIIRIQNLTGGMNYVYSDMELDANKYAEKDDLIYAWSATFGPYIWKGPKSIYHYHIWKIEVDENLLDKYFFFYRLDYISVEMHSQKNGSAFAHLTKGGMGNHEIPLPPLKEQKKIAEILLSVDEQIDAYEKEKEKQVELKKALMQQLLTGKLRVTV